MDWAWCHTQDPEGCSTFALFPSGPLVAGRGDPTFGPWPGDPLPGKLGTVVASKAGSLFCLFIYFVAYVFSGTVEEFRPVAKVIQGGGIRPHPGKRTAQCQEARSVVADSSCGTPNGE